jgi:hypothetical protein
VTIAGTHPEKGVRIALTLAHVQDGSARYRGSAFTAEARFELAMDVDVATGNATLTFGHVEPAGVALDAGDAAFARQVGRQCWKLATQTSPDAGGGQWPRRLQRWRGPK